MLKVKNGLKSGQGGTHVCDKDMLQARTIKCIMQRVALCTTASDTHVGDCRSAD